MHAIIHYSLALLDLHKEWYPRFEGYLKDIWNNSNKSSKGFNKPEGLSVYSTVSDRNNKNYHLRFLGQTVGKVSVNSSSVFLQSKVPANGKYFENCPLKEEDGEKDWNSEEATAFRSYFKYLDWIEMTKSPEHVVENLLLEEFKKPSSVNKALINIQPVCLHGQFFQMPTPFSASKNKVEYAYQYGGGIDMLARIVTNDNHIRLCVIEIKDESKACESQRKAMSQAIAYATFIAKLVTEQPDWWELFSDHEEKKGNTATRLDKKNIEVVTIMPAGTTETCDTENFETEDLGVTLCCRSLYYDKEIFKHGLTTPKDSRKALFNFTGTFLDDIKK